MKQSILVQGVDGTPVLAIFICFSSAQMFLMFFICIHTSYVSWKIYSFSMSFSYQNGIYLSPSSSRDILFHHGLDKNHFEHNYSKISVCQTKQNSQLRPTKDNNKADTKFPFKKFMKILLQITVSKTFELFKFVHILLQFRLSVLIYGIIHPGCFHIYHFFLVQIFWTNICVAV